MKYFTQHALFALAFSALLTAGQAMATVVDFIAGDGYADGDLTNNAAWFGDTAGNVVATGGAGYDGALGTVTLGTTSADEWVTNIFDEPFNLSQSGDTLTVSSRFQYSTTGAAMSANQAAIISFQFFDDSADLGGDFIRLGLRRMLTEQLRFFGGYGPMGAGVQSGSVTNEAAVGLTPSIAGTSDWLELSATLVKGADSNDWTLIAELMNLATTNLVLSHTFTGIAPNPGFQDDATIYGTINSSRSNEVSQTTGRTIDTFGVVAGFIPPPPAVATLIGGALGNGDFSAGGTTPATQTYLQTTNWFNSQGTGSDEDFNLTFDSQMGGSTDPNNGTVLRGAMVFNNRTTVNDTGYTVVSSAQVFSVSYDFGAGGNAGNWDGDETNRTFLFTTDQPVDGALTNASIVVLGEELYAVDRAADGQWTKHAETNLYTTTADDIGKTVYFGVEFTQGTGLNLFPRIDIIQLQVTVPAAPVGPLLSVERNGASLDVSWDSETGSNYQLQTNTDLTTTNWNDQGSAVAGDGATQTNSVPLSGDELYIRTEVQ